MLFLTELELLRLLPLRVSLGSRGCNPLAFAKRFNMSVRLTTPTRCPLSMAPVNADADTDGPEGAMNGVVADGGVAAMELCDGLVCDAVEE